MAFFATSVLILLSFILPALVFVFAKDSEAQAPTSKVRIKNLTQLFNILSSLELAKEEANKEQTIRTTNVIQLL